jgi:hypothetical protein
MRERKNHIFLLCNRLHQKLVTANITIRRQNDVGTILPLARKTPPQKKLELVNFSVSTYLRTYFLSN